jgi:hypothetical protein
LIGIFCDVIHNDITLNQIFTELIFGLILQIEQWNAHEYDTPASLATENVIYIVEKTYLNNFLDIVGLRFAPIFEGSNDFKASLFGALVQPSSTGNRFIIFLLLFNFFQRAASNTRRQILKINTTLSGYYKGPDKKRPIVPNKRALSDDIAQTFTAVVLLYSPLPHPYDVTILT